MVVLSVFGLTNVFLHKRFLGYGFNVWYYYNLPSGKDLGQGDPIKGDTLSVIGIIDLSLLLNY